MSSIDPEPLLGTFYWTPAFGLFSSHNPSQGGDKQTTHISVHEESVYPTLSQEEIDARNNPRMTDAYVIGHITVKDETKWVEYRNKVPATLEPWGGELVCRGKLSSVLAGDHKHTDTVVIRFPNLEAVDHWHSSPQYQSLVPLRREAADVDLLSYEE